LGNDERSPPGRVQSAFFDALLLPVSAAVPTLCLWGVAHRVGGSAGGGRPAARC